MTSWDLGLQLWSIRASGWLAAAALVLALSATPLGRLGARIATGERRRAFVVLVPKLRRALGITSACLAIVHAVVAATTWLRPQLALIWEWAHLRAGLVALVILVLMLLTSFPPIVRALRVRWWKELHRLGYLAAVLVLLHLLGSAFAARGIVIAVFAWLIAAGVLRALRQPVQPAERTGETDAKPPSI